jgi:hypothetical protein
MWMIVTASCIGDSVLFVVTGIVVTTVVGNGVFTGVNSAVGIVVLIVAVWVVVTGSGTACCVHPVNATNAITRIIKPTYFFMECRLLSCYN